MPSWRLFYRRVKGGVEPCFLGVFELFAEPCGGEQTIRGTRQIFSVRE